MTQIDWPSVERLRLSVSLLSPNDEHKESPPEGRRRSFSRWQIPVAIASLLLGVAISLQIRATSVAPTPSSAQRSDLLAELRTVESERNRLSAELAETRNRVSKIESTLGEGETLQRELATQFEQARLQAGLVPLKGPGVVIRLSDSPRQPGPDNVAYDYIVHDVDLSILVNELWASGAEAVSINEQRLVTRSSIRCVGPTVLVNTNRVASPFIVKAIGDVDSLEGGLKMPGGFLDSMSNLTNNGGEVVISRMREVTVPAYQGSLIFRFAERAEDETAGPTVGAES